MSWSAKSGLSALLDRLREAPARWRRLVKCTVALLLPTAIVGVLEAKELEVVIETWIEEGTLQAGPKSEVWLLADTTGHTVKKLKEPETGTTKMPLFRGEYESIDNRFEEKAEVDESGNTIISITGSTRAGVKFVGIKLMPPIDYELRLLIRPDGGYALSGCHDEFPAYKVTIDDEVVHYRPHEVLPRHRDIPRIRYLLQDCRFKVRKNGTLEGRSGYETFSSGSEGPNGTGGTKDGGQNERQEPNVDSRSANEVRSSGRFGSERQRKRGESTDREGVDDKKRRDTGSRARRELDRVSDEARKGLEALDVERKEMDEDFLIPFRGSTSDQ